jgi:uncharacterized YceG family protein
VNWVSPIAVAALAACIAWATPAHAAKPDELHVIFQEGMSVRQMIDRVAAVRRIAIAKRHVTPRLDGRSYAAAARAVAPPRGFPRGSVEGFLFPSTYEFGPVTSAEELVALQLDAFEAAWRRVDLRAARARGLSPYDVLVIASMVERETAVAAERPLVAAVIANRLAKGMPLAIDATIRYGLGIEGTRPLTAKALASDSPYNTRRFAGLPPTPIGNPGLASMLAAAHPAAVDYVYYVRKRETKHHFFTADEDEFCRKALEYGYHC